MREEDLSNNQPNEPSLSTTELELTKLTGAGPFLDEDGKVAVRTFVYSDRVIISFLVQELDDSFLVILPGSLQKTSEDAITLDLSAPATPVRLFKNDLRMIYSSTPNQLLYYLELCKRYHGDFPGYFTPTRKAHLENLHKLLGKLIVERMTAAKAAKAVKPSTKDLRKTPDPAVMMPPSITKH